MEDEQEVTDADIISSEDDTARTIRVPVVEMIERYKAVRDYFAEVDDGR